MSRKTNWTAPKGQLDFFFTVTCHLSKVFLKVRINQNGNFLSLLVSQGDNWCENPLKKPQKIK